MSQSAPSKLSVGRYGDLNADRYAAFHGKRPSISGIKWVINFPALDYVIHLCSMFDMRL